jgi:hypothetical protein
MDMILIDKGDDKHLTIAWLEVVVYSHSYILVR